MKSLVSQPFAVGVAASVMFAVGGAPGSAVAGPPGRGASGPGAYLSIGCTLAGVATTSSSDAWAVGSTCNSRLRPILAHWDGSAWTRVTPGALPAYAFLNGVTKFAGGDWVVGAATRVVNQTLQTRPLILRLTGSTWKR